MRELSVNTLQFLVDKNGNRSAVQLGIQDWQALVQYLEDLEDRAIVKDKLARLMKHPLQAGAIPWEEAKKAW